MKSQRQDSCDGGFLRRMTSINTEPQTDVETNTDHIVDSNSITDEADRFNGNCVVNVKGKRGMRVDGLIEGTPLEWKIDTGAVNTFITEDTYYSILPEYRPVLERVRKKFETADGSELQLTGTAIMTLSFDNFDVCFRVFVGKVRCNLLGLDFITKFQGNWNYSDSTFVLHSAECAQRSCRVVSAESVIVPPKHESVIKSVITSKPDSSDGILIPLKVFIHSHGLALARVLVNAEADVIYVRVFNPSEKEVNVSENTELAVCVPVISVCDTCDTPTGSDVNAVNSLEHVLASELPEHLRVLFETGCEHLNPEQCEEFNAFLLERQSAFADPGKLMERARIGEHFIKLQDETPFKEPPRRVPIFKREILDEEIRKLEEQGLIEKSTSPWSSPLVLVQKKDKSWRLCVDYRRLNSKTIKDAYPIPRVADDLDSLAGSKWFTSLDLNMAYHQIPMCESDKEKTAFATPRGGLYQYRVMPFGLCNAPATFQRVIETALRGLQWYITVLYLDDIIVFGRSFEDHLCNLALVFDRLQNANLKLKAKKCRFFCKEVNFLGHVVSESGIRTDPEKTNVVKNWKRPENVSELRSFLGLVSYYRRFIKDFANIAKCLHALTSKNSKWQWTRECEDALN